MSQTVEVDLKLKLERLSKQISGLEKTLSKSVDGSGEKMGKNVSRGLEKNADGSRAGSKISKELASRGGEAGLKFGDMFNASLLANLAGAGIQKAFSGLFNGFKAAGGIAINFESAMNQVRAVSGATGDAFDNLRNQAKELGKTTQFSATQAAEGQAFLAQAGFKTNEIMGAMPDVLNLAAAGNLDLGRAADIASNIMGQFGIEAAKVDRVTNVLAATAASSNTDINQLSEAMKYLGPTANSLGITLEDTAAIVGILGDAGIQGSMAGTTLGTSLTRLAKPTKEMRGIMSDLNLEFFDANGTFVGTKSMLEQVERATTDLTQEQKTAALSTLFGTEAYKSINVLLERGSVAYGEYTKSITGTNKAAEMARIQQEGWGGALTSLKSALEGLAIELLDVEIGGKKMIEWLSEATTKVVNFVRNIDLQKIVDGFGLLFSVIGGGLAGGLIASVIGGFTALTTAITVAGGTAAFVGGIMATIFSPVTLIIGGLALAAGLLYIAWQNDFMGIRNMVMPILETIKGGFQFVLDGIAAFSQGVSIETIQAQNALKEVEKSAEEMQVRHAEEMTALTEKHKQQTALLPTMTQEDAAAMKLAMEAEMIEMKNSHAGEMHEIVQKHTEESNKLVEVQSTTTNVLRELWDGYLNYVKSIWEITWGTIKAFIAATLLSIVAIFTGDTEKLKEIWGAFGQRVLELSGEAGQGIIDGIQKGIDYLKNTDLEKVGQDMIKGLINGINSMAGKVWESMKNLARNAINGAKGELKIQSPSKVMAQIGAWTGEGFVDGVKGQFGDVINTAKGMSNAFTKTLSSGVLATGIIGSATFGTVPILPTPDTVSQPATGQTASVAEPLQPGQADRIFDEALGRSGQITQDTDSLIGKISEELPKAFQIANDEIGISLTGMESSVVELANLMNENFITIFQEMGSNIPKSIVLGLKSSERLAYSTVASLSNNVLQSIGAEIEGRKHNMEGMANSVGNISYPEINLARNFKAASAESFGGGSGGGVDNSRNVNFGGVQVQSNSQLEALAQKVNSFSY